MKIKLCGVTSVEDALLCADSGADIIGLIFYPGSRRCVTAQTAVEISVAINGRVELAGVFVDEQPDAVRKTAETLGLDYLQFHGKESPEYCAGFAGEYKIIKVLFPENQDISSLKALYDVDFFLFDVLQNSKEKDSDKILDVSSIREQIDDKCFVSGGITPENISDVLSGINAYAVDIARGSEFCPGKKDLDKVRRLINIVKKAEL